MPAQLWFMLETVQTRCENLGVNFCLDVIDRCHDVQMKYKSVDYV